MINPVADITQEWQRKGELLYFSEAELENINESIRKDIEILKNNRMKTTISKRKHKR